MLTLRFTKLSSVIETSDERCSEEWRSSDEADETIECLRLILLVTRFTSS